MQKLEGVAYLFAFGVVAIRFNFVCGWGCWGIGQGAKLTGAGVSVYLLWYGRTARIVAKLGALVELGADISGLTYWQ